MTLTRKISFIMYGIVGISLIGAGFWYLFSTEIKSYHLAAMGVASWSELAPNVQAMTLNFLRAAGLGFLTTGGTILVLLMIPFRKGEAWARYAIAAISIFYTLVMIGVMLSVRAATPGHPPVTGMVLLCALAVCGYFLSSLD